MFKTREIQGMHTGAKRQPSKSPGTWAEKGLAEHYATTLWDRPKGALDKAETRKKLT